MEFSPSFIAGVDAVGTALLHFFWQGAVIALAYAALRPLCRGVQSHYRLGFGLLVVSALCPIATLVYLWPSAGEPAAGTIGPLLTGTINAVTDGNASVSHLRDYLPALVAIWIVGVLLIATRSLFHWHRIQRLVKTASVPGAEWQQRLARMCARFGLSRPVRLLVSAKVATPMLVGWFKPVVLLPLSMLSGFTPHQIELIIAHELGHVRRWDYLANLFQVIVETVLFYHPAVHWISRDVRNARESCCDDLVLSLADGSPLAYARALADLEELRHDMDVVAPALGASGGVLLARIRRIVGVEGHDPLPRTATWPLLLVLAAMLTFAVRPRDSMPDLLTALSRLPVEGLAVIGGTPKLTVAPYQAPRATLGRPSLELQPDALDPADGTLAAPVDLRIALERPRIDAGAAPSRSVRDVIAGKLAAPSLAPVAAAEESAHAPLRTAMVSPVYPARASLAGVEGNVELQYAIDASGRPTDIRVLQSQPEGVFDSAAIAALAQWRFERPSGSGGSYMQNFAFTLHNKPANTPPNNQKCTQTIGSLICRQFDE